MRRISFFIRVLLMLVLGVQLFVSSAMADTFGSGGNAFEIEFVTIGNPGNPPDTTGKPNPAASVPYRYRIGKYEISEQMIDKANALGGLGITKDTRGPNKPATRVHWFESAKFVNWLNTSTGHMPAYKFDGNGNFQLWEPSDPGYDPNNLYRNSLATYFLPSVHEWYKAAYFDPTPGTYFDYPTGSNSPPITVASGTGPGTAVYGQDLSAGPADIMLAGGLSPYGTMAQGGNVAEWEETDFDLVNDNASDYRGRRGGAWNDSFHGLQATTRGEFPSFPSPLSLGTTGFRVASIVPEPAAIALLVMGFLGIFASIRRLSSRRRCDDAKSRQWLE